LHKQAHGPCLKEFALAIAADQAQGLARGVLNILVVRLRLHHIDEHACQGGFDEFWVPYVHGRNVRERRNSSKLHLLDRSETAHLVRELEQAVSEIDAPSRVASGLPDEVLRQYEHENFASSEIRGTPHLVGKRKLHRRLPGL